MPLTSGTDRPNSPPVPVVAKQHEQIVITKLTAKLLFCDMVEPPCQWPPRCVSFIGPQGRADHRPNGCYFGGRHVTLL